MGDRTGEAEQPRRQRVHVDRIAVAGNGRVLAPDVAGDVPFGADAQLLGRLALVVAAGARRVRSTVSALPQIGAPAAPDGRAVDLRLGDHVELTPSLVVAQVLGPHAEVHPAADGDRLENVDPVRDMHEADNRERKRAVGHLSRVE